MHLFRSHGLVHLQVHKMVLNMIFYSGLFKFPVPTFPFCELDSVAGTLGVSSVILDMVVHKWLFISGTHSVPWPVSSQFPN